MGRCSKCGSPDADTCDCPAWGWKDRANELLGARTRLEKRLEALIGAVETFLGSLDDGVDPRYSVVKIATEDRICALTEALAAAKKIGR